MPLELLRQALHTRSPEHRVGKSRNSMVNRLFPTCLTYNEIRESGFSRLLPVPPDSSENGVGGAGLPRMQIVGNLPLHGRTNGKNYAQLDPVRRRLLRLIAESRTNLRTASLAIDATPPTCTSSLTGARPACWPRTTARRWRSTWAAAPICCGTTGASGAGRVRIRRHPVPTPHPKATASSRRSMYEWPRVRVLGTMSRRRSRSLGCSPIRSSATSSGPSTPSA